MGDIVKLLIPAALAATLLMTAAAEAATCADYASTTVMSNNNFSETTVPLPINFAAGDSLTISINWQRTSAAGATATLQLRDGATTIGSTSMAISGTTGGPTAFPAITLSAAVSNPSAIIDVPNTNSTNTYSVRLSCSPAAVVGGGATSTSSETITSVQQGQAQVAAFRSANMISGLASGGIDAAYSGADDTSIMAFGYAGSAIIDATPAELASSGFNLWTGARYEVAIPQAGQWSGAQGSVAGGLNYRVDDRWIVGVFAAYDQAGYNRGTDSLASRGAALGVTAAYRLDETWRVEMIGTLERLRYEIGSAGVTGAFDATRITVDGTLKGILPISAQVDFVPSLGLMVLREDQGAYTDSASVAHGASALQSGQLSAGGRFVFFPTGALDAVFSIGGRGDYSIASSNGGFAATVDAGVDFNLSASSTLSLNAALNGIAGAKGQSASIQAKLSGAL